MLDADLASSLIQARVGLHKHLPRDDVAEDHVSHAGRPEIGFGCRHIREELGPGALVCSGLVDVQLLEVLPDGYSFRVSKRKCVV